MKKAIQIILFVLVCGFSAQAQMAPFESMTIIGWDINEPVGSANDKYINNTSFIGTKLEYRYMVSKNISVGTEISWNSFYQYKPTETYQITNGAITADLYKSRFTVPVVVNGQYYLTTEGKFFPYLGLAAGFNYADSDLYVNIYQVEKSDWGMVVRPEIGTIINISEAYEVGLLLAARYSYATNSSSTLKFDNIQNVGFQFGLVWMK